jgi:hypothetical protein
LLQVSVSWNDEPSWPYIQITSGSGTVLGILFWAYKFGFDIDLISRTWNWDYMSNIKDLEELGEGRKRLFMGGREKRMKNRMESQRNL